MEQLEEIPKEQKFYTRYEDFVSNVHGIIREIDQKFCLASEKRVWSQIPETLENRNIKFRKEFSTSEIDIIVTRCKPLMEQFDYNVYDT